MLTKSTVKKMYLPIDKVYHLTNLKLVWKKVKPSRESGVINRTGIKDFINVTTAECIGYCLCLDAFNFVMIRIYSWKK